VIFLPWSLDPGYRRKIDDDFAMDGEEKKLAELYSLDAEQIAWRRAKISQLGSADYFAQEYPLTPSEAFISSTFDSFIPANVVMLSASQSAGRAASGACLVNSDHDNDSGCPQELVTAGNYTLSESGTFPPFSASLIITCLCSQIFMSAELAISPV
jgi:hypothetical protein